MRRIRRILMLALAGLLAVGTIGVSEARAQHRGGYRHSRGFARGYGGGYGYGSYRPRSYGYVVPRGGYYLGGGYGGGYYGRPSGYAYSYGYAPGYGGYYGPGFYGSGYGYSNYRGYCR